MFSLADNRIDLVAAAVVQIATQKRLPDDRRPTSDAPSLSMASGWNRIAVAGTDM